MNFADRFNWDKDDFEINPDGAEKWREENKEIIDHWDDDSDIDDEGE